jgi:hypothetical protein
MWNRKIKIKAFDKRNCFMLESKLIADISFHYEVLHYNSVRPEVFTDINWKGDQYIHKNGTHNDVFFDDVILLQHTELKNKDGVDLDWWEGDVFEHESSDVKKSCRFVIIFDKAGFRAKKIGCNIYNTELHHFLFAHEDIKKIGNIHENPELLEAK